MMMIEGSMNTTWNLKSLINSSNYFVGHNKPITAMGISKNRMNIFTGASDGQVCKLSQILIQNNRRECEL